MRISERLIEPRYALDERGRPGRLLAEWNKFLLQPGLMLNGHFSADGSGKIEWIIDGHFCDQINLHHQFVGLFGYGDSGKIIAEGILLPVLESALWAEFAGSS